MKKAALNVTNTEVNPALKLSILQRSKRRLFAQYQEVIIRALLFLCALLSVATTALIIFILFKESLGFFNHVSLSEFFLGTRWVPLLEPASFGVLPLLWGTLVVTIGAALFAVPLGLTSAIYLSEYADPKTRAIAKPILEILAGIPTVVYGYFALISVTPVLQMLLPEVQVFNALSAAIVVGIMILPMIISLSDNALQAVPETLRQSGYALGATSYEVSTQIVLPAGLSGIMASFLLAISRAVGETMVVTMAAGATPSLSFNILESIQTMTAYIVQISLGDTPAGGIAYQTIFVVALLLFGITLIINLISQWILHRYQEVYD